MLPLRFFAAAAVAAIFCGAPHAAAVQVYTFYYKQCAASAGALINVDDEAAHVLGFDGAIRSVTLADVAVVARYDLHENPFTQVGMTKHGPPLLTVASESSEGTFQAFATNFVEDLVLFLDTSGKIRVVEMDEIVSIIYSPPSATDDKPQQRPVKLISPPGRGQCPPVVAGQSVDGVVGEHAATQVMGDKLRIDSFFARMRAGYQALESLRERTLFYARPLLFDQKTRLGIIATRGNRYELYESAAYGWEQVPLYLEFGSGSSYRFQSSTSLGNRTWKMIPQMRNFGAVRSEFKSHLLHGTFLANFDGFTAGKPLFIDRWSGKTRRQAWLDSSFNHLTLLGADYGAWSMSYGYYFPSFAVAQGEEFRELTAAKASPAFHFGYIQNAWQVDLFLFNTNYQEDIGTKVEDVYDPGYLMRKDGSLRSYSKRSIPQSVRLTSTSARLNGQWFPTEDLKLGADVAFTRTGYKESALRRNTPMPGENDEFDPDSSEPPDFSSVAIERIVRQQLWAARTGVHIDLGQWVALSGEALLEHATTEGALGDEENLKKSDFIKTYVLVMELLL